jgi:hypothetical protein
MSGTYLGTPEGNSPAGSPTPTGASIGGNPNNASPVIVPTPQSFVSNLATAFKTMRAGAGGLTNPAAATTNVPPTPAAVTFAAALPARAPILPVAGTGPQVLYAPVPVVGAGGNQAPPATPVGNAPPTPTVTATRTPPLMGGIDADGIAWWSGGKPKVDWSSLESATAKKRSPNCINSDKASEQVKAYNHRIAKPDDVFTKNTPTFDHVAYVEQIHAHVENTSMDAVFYVPGMHNNVEMVSVIKGYDKVTLEHVAK